ncbi:MAG: fibro-slime domain-containing protein [Fibrobacterales bacterium]
MVHSYYIRALILLSAISTVVFAANDKTLILFSPWSNTQPQVVINGVSKTMVPDTVQCGWYSYTDTTNELSQFYLSNKFDETYGKSGKGKADYITGGKDKFLSEDTLYLYFKSESFYDFQSTRPTPSTSGYCLKSVLPGEFIDWNEYDLDSAFQFPNMGCTTNTANGAVIGLVGASLNSDGLPIANAASPRASECRTTKLTDWFKPLPDSSNYKCQDIQMEPNVTTGNYEFSSFTEVIKADTTIPGDLDSLVPNTGFFPLDDFTNSKNLIGSPYSSKWGEPYSLPSTSGYQHNYHFCMKTQTSFTYREGQQFIFNGDDDLWIFVDSTLALDIGGTHIPVSDTLNLDEFLKDQGTNTVGSRHSFDLFYCERHTLQSNLQIQTDIDFDQPIKYGHTKSGIIYTVTEGEEPTNGCQAQSTVISKISKFYLRGHETNETLTPSSTYYQGITIDTNRFQFTLDVPKINGLTADSTYYIIHESISSTTSKPQLDSVAFVAPKYPPYSIIFTDSEGNPIDSSYTLPTNESVRLYTIIMDKTSDGTAFICTACNDSYAITLPDDSSIDLEDLKKDFKKDFIDGIFSFEISPKNNILSIDDLKLTLTYSGFGTNQGTDYPQSALTPSITFTEVEGPYIKSAEIYDNGTYIKEDKLNSTSDGWADSVVVSISNWQGEPEEITLCIGKSENDCQSTTFTSDDWNALTPGDSTLVITRNFNYDDAGYFTDIGGYADAFFYEKGGKRFESHRELDDMIGPIIIHTVIKKDPLLEDGPGEDTLTVTFSEPVENVKAEDWVFIINDSIIQVSSVIDNQRSEIWDFTIDVSKFNIVDGDSISLYPYSGLQDRQGNIPGDPNIKVPIQELKHIPAPERFGHYFLDMDEDGTMDRISLVYSWPIINAEFGGNDVLFQWIDKDNAIIELHPRPSDWVSDPNDPFRMFWDVPASLNIKPYMTYFYDNSFKDAIVFNFDTTYAIDTSITVEENTVTLENSETIIQKDTIRTLDSTGFTIDTSTTLITMEDKMSPVIQSAVLIKGGAKDNKGASIDSLYLSFSEEVNTDDMINNGRENYFFKHKDSEGDAVEATTILEAEDSDWNQEKHSLTYLDNASDSFRLTPTDSIRLRSNTRYVSDAHGNSPGDNAPWVVIKGRMEPEAGIQDYQEYSSGQDKLNDFEANNASAFYARVVINDSIGHSTDDLALETSKEFEQVGILIQGNFWNIIQGNVDKSVFEDIPDHEIKEHLSFSYHMTIYSNLGEYVTQSRKTITCTDKIFGGDCTNPDIDQWLWIGWDPVSEDGRLVGNGVYLSIFEYSIHYPGGATPRKVRRDRFGYMRIGND